MEEHIFSFLVQCPFWFFFQRSKLLDVQIAALLFSTQLSEDLHLGPK